MSSSLPSRSSLASFSISSAACLKSPCFMASAIFLGGTFAEGLEVLELLLQALFAAELLAALLRARGRGR